MNSSGNVGLSQDSVLIIFLAKADAYPEVGTD